MKINEIDTLIIKMSERASSVRGFNRKLELTLRNIVKEVTNIANSNASTKGYCLTFIVPEDKIQEQILPILQLDVNEIRVAVADAWKTPLTARVKTRPYVVILSLLIAYAARYDIKKIGEHAIELLLIMNWNQHLRKSFPKECNPEIMAYVIANMASKQFTVTKYSDPLEMIEKHFVPAMMKKYFADTKNNSELTKRISDQAFSRIGQIFRSGQVVNLNTKERSAKTGIAVLYYEAHRNNNRIRQNKADSEKDMFDFTTSHSLDDLTAEILQVMRHTIDPVYDKRFYHAIERSNINIKKANIDIIISNFYTIQRDNLYEDAVSMFVSRIQDDLSKACSNEYYQIVKRKIVSSKHNIYVSKLKELEDRILEDIFKVSFPNALPFHKWGPVYKTNFRELITYVIAFYVSKTICSRDS